MKKIQRGRNMVLALALVLGMCGAGATFDMYEEMGKIWSWSKPDPYPSNLDELDVDTLSALLDSGNLQWYEPRPEQGKWDAVVGMKVHAPPQTFWEVTTDYALPCKIMAKTFKSCKPVSKNGNEVRTDYTMETRVLEYGTTFAMNDLAVEDPPYHQRLTTVEGGLEGREVDIRLLPIDGGQNTIVFMRYYAHMESLGMAMQAVLALVPDSEWPVAAASANYHLREHKIEAERRAGYQPPEKPAELDYNALDIATLGRLARWQAGLIRETYAGKNINGLTYAFVDAPPEAVYNVIADLERYNDRFKNQETTVERRGETEVLVQQKIMSQSVLVFTFAYEMHARYQLDPPYHISYNCIDGTYEGSTGDYQILPVEGGKKSVLFAAIGINFEKDDALTSRIIRSGDYPFNTVMNLLAARSYLNNFKPVAEKIAREKQ